MRWTGNFTKCELIIKSGSIFFFTCCHVNKQTCRRTAQCKTKNTYSKLYLVCLRHWHKLMLRAVDDAVVRKLFDSCQRHYLKFSEKRVENYYQAKTVCVFFLSHSVALAIDKQQLKWVDCADVDPPLSLKQCASSKRGHTNENSRKKTTLKYCRLESFNLMCILCRRIFKRFLWLLY